MSQQDDGLTALLMQNLDSHFKQLVETYQHQLYRLMYHQVGNAQDAEDIVQETFLRAYYALRNYAMQEVQIQHIRPWLYKIAFNLYYNRLRVVQPQIFPLDTQEGNVLLELENLWLHDSHRVREAVYSSNLFSGSGGGRKATGEDCIREVVVAP